VLVANIVVVDDLNAAGAGLTGGGGVDGLLSSMSANGFLAATDMI
jgi:hypothetical protein